MREENIKVKKGDDEGWRQDAWQYWYGNYHQPTVICVVDKVNYM
jgi:hypothetical protein